MTRLPTVQQRSRECHQDTDTQANSCDRPTVCVQLCLQSWLLENLIVALPSKGHKPAVKPADADHASKDGSAPSVTYCLKGLTTCLPWT